MESNGVNQRFIADYRERQFSNNNERKNRSLESLQKTMMGQIIVDNEHSSNKEKIRFIKKSGHCNVSHINLNDKSRRFLADIFTTGVDLQWRWNLFVFSAAFVVSWLLFGLLFWLFSYIHGDFDKHTNSTFKPCISELDTDSPFISTFLFSLETQTTIGYGYRHVTEECWVTILIVVLQSVFGCILDAFMIGLIMAKISRPKKRAETLLFSRNAVINVRDGRLCFMVRVGNLRKSHLVEATIRMQFVYSRKTIEGEYIPIEQIDLNLDLKNDSDRLFLVTPQTICHPIDENSPLYEFTKDDLQNSDFEVIVILEGMVEATGMTTQARASYLPSEIKWGHRFCNMISLSRNNAYKVNFKIFHDTYLTPDAPNCSAKELHESKNKSQAWRRGNQSGSESSSCRSSTASQQPFPVSDNVVSQYSPIDDIKHSRSRNSLNKMMTSTTSLSDDSDFDKGNKNKQSIKSSSSSLIDFSSPKVTDKKDFAIDDEQSSGDNKKTGKNEPILDCSASSQDENLLIMSSAGPAERSIINSSPESESKQSGYVTLSVENDQSVCA